MKQLCIFLCAFIIAGHLSAQKVELGVKGGFNIADLHFSNNITTNSKVGVHLGVLAHIHASQKWAIQPEFMYSLEGANNIDDSHTNYTLNYINVPVLLQYMLGRGFRLEGGPQLDFLLSAKAKTGDASFITNHFQSNGVSFPLGFSYVGANGVGIDARYVFGMSNINADKHDEPTIQSNVFQLGIFLQMVNNNRGHYHHR